MIWKIIVCTLHKVSWSPATYSVELCVCPHDLVLPSSSVINLSALPLDQRQLLCKGRGSNPFFICPSMLGLIKSLKWMLEKKKMRNNITRNLLFNIHSFTEKKGNYDAKPMATQPPMSASYLAPPRRLD